METAQGITKGVRAILAHASMGPEDSMTHGLTYRECQQSAVVIPNHISSINEFQSLFNQKAATSVNHGAMLSQSVELSKAVDSLTPISNGVRNIANGV
ncbi:MAG: hypothetical protein EOP34_04085 [Rickettsiales bacterium]|nr:MAG: hypothetical protein EOP34_04085 [Rickettsiales bacterium]